MGVVDGTCDPGFVFTAFLSVSSFVVALCVSQWRTRDTDRLQDTELRR